MTSNVISHLLELRRCLLQVVVAFILLALVLSFFANELFSWLSGPLLNYLPDGSSMIATQVATPFLTPFKLSMVAAMLLCVPFAIYQAWTFVAPGLYAHEKKNIYPLLLASVSLFFLGMLFVYYVIFPIMFGFFTSHAPPGVAIMTDISAYLDFVLTLLFAFGFAFQVPIVTYVLITSGVTTASTLREYRPYIILLAFTLGMLLTPPDVISQTLLAVPICLLFELGVWLAVRGKAKAD